MAAQHTAREVTDIARGNRLNQAQQDAAHHRTGQITDAAKHRSGEGLQARQKAHGVLHRAVVGGPHYTGQSGQHRANDESGRDDGVRAHAHQSGHTWVLGGGSHGTTQTCAVDHPHQHGQRNGGHTQNHDLRGRDDCTANVDGVSRQQGWESFVVGLPNDHGQGLQQDRHTDGGDEGCQLRCAAQRAVGNLLNGKVQSRRHRASHHQRNEQYQPPWHTRHMLL